MQLGLTLTVAAFALRSLKAAPVYWFVLTAIAAALAATQDVFVDAFAVRVLRPSERGFGNTAQVAGYRLGMLVGGAALLLLVGSLGERVTLHGCAAIVAIASIGAFVGSGEAITLAEESPPRAPLRVLRSATRSESRSPSSASSCTCSTGERSRCSASRSPSSSGSTDRPTRVLRGMCSRQ